MSNISLRDAPIESESDCRLGPSDYADVLYKFMAECETPLTIGLQGDWGIGKTSLIRMIQGKLSDGRGKGVIPFVDFNTWQYSLFGQEQLLAVSCIRALVQQIAELQPDEEASAKESVTNTARRALDIAGAVVQSLSVSMGPVSVDTASVKEKLGGNTGPDDIAGLMVKFKDDFAQLVELVTQSSQSSRIVIFIDDLDRVKPVRALELLETLKNFLDVPGCVFVLAVDYDVVQMGMKEKLGEDLQRSSGKSFFDKIINVPFNMPTTSYRLGDYIGELLKESGFITRGLDTSTKEFFADITTVTVGRNPRNIKRVVNYAKLLEGIRKQSLQGYKKRTGTQYKKSGKDMQILYALMCMQIAWPELFRYFANHPTADTVKNLENWEFLEELPEGRTVISRSPDPQQIKSDIGAFVDELFRLLDTDPEDGEISSKEMQPVLQIMQLAKLTTAETAKTPLEQYQEQVKLNGGTREARFLEKVFQRSSWGARGDCEYRKSTSRYWSIVMRRRQIGSLVSLKSKGHLIFRLKAQPEELLRHIHASLHRESVTNEAIFREFESIIQPLANSSLTGFGETLILTDKLRNMKQKRAIAFLDWIYRATKAAHFDRAALLATTPVAHQPESAAEESPGLSEASAAIMDGV